MCGFYCCYATTVPKNAFESQCSFDKCLAYFNLGPKKVLRCSFCLEDAEARRFKDYRQAKV